MRRVTQTRQVLLPSADRQFFMATLPNPFLKLTGRNRAFVEGSWRPLALRPSRTPPSTRVVRECSLAEADYTAQLRKLEQQVQSKPNGAAAKRMLAALAPPEVKTSEPLPAAAEAADGPSTDLVGNWLAKNSDATVELTITAESTFTWRVTPTGKTAVKLTGNVAASSDELVLETKDQGNMAGKVKSGGADKFTFIMPGMPPMIRGSFFPGRSKCSGQRVRNESSADYRSLRAIDWLRRRCDCRRHAR